MELIIFIAVVVVAALLWTGHVKDTQSKAESKIDDWQPSSNDKPWPYGEKIADGKIHVKSADVAPGKSADDRVEAPAPLTVAETVTTVVENRPAKKPAVKKAAAKKPAVKKAAAKKKST
jgi:hypothetical protein